MVKAYRPLPDPEINLRDARDFILDGALARKAGGCSEPQLTVFVQDLLANIYRLSLACHLPEFTDHGLPHLCSLVDRVQRWQRAVVPTLLVDELTEDEAAMLLLALLIHDVGMLSQNPADLPEDASPEKSKGVWADVASWVRVTHVDRLERLVLRLARPEYGAFVRSDIFQHAIEIAKSHQAWPWRWQGPWQDHSRRRGLAAIVAVADLLDEDAARCDTVTLLQHREGTEVNRAHWLRHGLTDNRVLVRNGRISVTSLRPPGTTKQLRPVFSALRNHFKLVHLYESDLDELGASIEVDFFPSSGMPEETNGEIVDWQRLKGFETEEALCFQLLGTFMPEALKDSERLDEQSLNRIAACSMEDVYLTAFRHARGKVEVRSQEEQTFFAMSSE